MTHGAALDLVDTSQLLVPIHRELIALLRDLTTKQWLAPTSAGTWRVRDVAAHLLDGQLRRLSYHRDGLPRWTIRTDEPWHANATVRFEAEAGARLWYSGRGPHPAGTSAACDGDPGLCDAVLAARAVMV